jgi:hypothetical protein
MDPECSMGNDAKTGARTLGMIGENGMMKKL